MYVFSCTNKAARNSRFKAKFSIEIPPEKTEAEIRGGIFRILEEQIGKR